MVVYQSTCLTFLRKMYLTLVNGQEYDNASIRVKGVQQQIKDFVQWTKYVF